MHKSRLATLVIDVPPEKLQEAVRFWSAAFGRDAAPMKDPKYYEFEGSFDKLRVLIQAIDGNPEVHLDIHSDDVPAESARLQALGATSKKQKERWDVMTAPSGHAFCVVKDEASNLENAAVWSDDQG